MNKRAAIYATLTVLSLPVGTVAFVVFMMWAKEYFVYVLVAAFAVFLWYASYQIFDSHIRRKARAKTSGVQ